MYLKYSQISPILKKGDKNAMSIYRPISLLTSFSKVFEKAIYSRLQLRIQNNNIPLQELYCF